MSREGMFSASGASEPQPQDLAGRDFWDRVWTVPRSSRVNPISFYHALYMRLFGRMVRPGMRVLEAGCGGSIWLPFLARSLHAEVWGIDYSEVGAKIAERNLRIAGVAGKIIIDNVLSTTALPAGGFDLVFSFGLIEHFSDPVAVVRRLAGFLAPRGRMLTSVPNLYGAVGLLHRVADPEIYQAHLRFTPSALDAVHIDAGLTVVERARYLGVFSLGVVNFYSWRRRLPRLLGTVLWWGVLALQQAAVLPWRLIGWYPESRRFSPWVQGVYRKP